MRLLALVLVLAACAADPVLPPRDCTPGQTSACACAGGATGVQTCGPSATLGACACPDGGAGADVVDAGLPLDAPALEDRPAADAATVPDVAPAPDAADAGAVCDASLATDPANCGRCGNACPARANAGVDCNAGACGIVCREGYRDCDRAAENGCEVDTSSDRANCGACGRMCAAGQVCELARCKDPCPAGETRCLATPTSDGVCRDLQTDRNNCGGCDRQCPAGMPRCAAGACVRG